MTPPNAPPSLPRKAKTLRTLRKFYPGARIQIKGMDAILYYRVDGTEVEALSIEVKETQSEAAMAYALCCAASIRLGYQPRWNVKTKQIEFSAVPGYVGPEGNLPIELDPDISEEEVARLKLSHNQTTQEDNRKDADQERREGEEDRAVPPEEAVDRASGGGEVQPREG